jgi:hypothetical protein
MIWQMLQVAANANWGCAAVIVRANVHVFCGEVCVDDGHILTGFTYTYISSVALYAC